MDIQINELKKEIRRDILRKRKNMSDADKIEASISICDSILKTKYYEEAKKICVYMPINNEVDLKKLVEYAFNEGKKIYLPKVIGKEMEFFFYDRESKLIKGAYDILEPEGTIKLCADENTLVIMPGAVFSIDRDRIGYGGGYYDRYLSKNSCVKKIAVAYQFQILERLPAEAYDIKPDIIVTEKQIIR